MVVHASTVVQASTGAWHDPFDPAICMETRNTKLEIHRKAIAKHHMPLLPRHF